MIETEEVHAVRNGFKQADASVDAAVLRLMDSGKSRKDALALIDVTLYEVVRALHSVGIGQTSLLRKMNLSARTKLNAIRTKEANEEDGRNSI